MREPFSAVSAVLNFDIVNSPSPFKVAPEARTNPSLVFSFAHVIVAPSLSILSVTPEGIVTGLARVNACFILIVVWRFGLFLHKSVCFSRAFSIVLNDFSDVVPSLASLLPLLPSTQIMVCAALG